MNDRNAKCVNCGLCKVSCQNFAINKEFEQNSALNNSALYAE